MSPTSRVVTSAATVLAVAVSACGSEADPLIGGPEAAACEQSPGAPSLLPDLPVRAGPPAVTTGEVPHQQIDPEIIPEVIAELHSRVFSLPDVESRPTIIGATAIWLREEINLGRPECVVAGREIAHIHLDGSLHAVLSHGRIPGAVSAGWAEPHPWAGIQPGFEAFVLLFSPRSSEEVDVLFGLVLDGLNFVTGG